MVRLMTVPMTELQQAQRGFTLQELIIVILIVGIMASLAAPSFQSFIQNQRVQSLSSELLTSLTLARSEAIKRNNNVVVTPVSGVWHNGWVISADGTELQQVGAFDGVAVSTVAASVTYQKNGRAATSSFQIDLSDQAVSEYVRCVSTTLSGAVRINQGAC